MATKTWFCVSSWIAFGVAVGFFLGHSQSPTILYASGAVSQQEDYSMATGASPSTAVDLVWILDYKNATLLCLGMDRNQNLIKVGEMDLEKAFATSTKGTKSSKSKNPKFMLVTGRYGVNSSSDYAYVADTVTGRIVVVSAVGNVGPAGLPTGGLSWSKAISFRGE